MPMVRSVRISTHAVPHEGLRPLRSGAERYRLDPQTHPAQEVDGPTHLAGARGTYIDSVSEGVRGMKLFS